MTYISKSEFDILSDIDKNTYYEKLRTVKDRVFTAKDMDDLAQAYEELQTYKNSFEHARELRISAGEQRKADVQYNAERRKKGLLISVMVIAGFVFAASIFAIIQMFS